MEKIRNFGPLFVFLSGVCFALGGLCMKYIPWNGMAINGARNVLGLIVIGGYILCTGHKLVINKPVIIGALSIAVTMSLYSVANKLTTAGNAIILQFTAPIWVMIFSVIVLKTKPTKLDITAAALVLAGVLFFFIDSLSAGNMPGNLLALISGVTYVGVFTMQSMDGADSLSSTFFGICLNILVGLPFLITQDYSTTTTTAWIALLVLGFVQQGCSYICLNKGLATTPPIAASLISGIEPVLNPVLVAVFYGEYLTTLALIGAAIVLITIVTYNVLRVKLSDKAAV